MTKIVEVIGRVGRFTYKAKFTGLPWAVFWLKELVTWGALEPVAAYLVAKSLVTTRTQGQDQAAGYYSSAYAVAASDPLDPRAIRRWAESTVAPKAAATTSRPPRSVRTSFTEDFSEAEQTRWPGLPGITNGVVSWFDPAGYKLAEGGTEPELGALLIDDYDFVLDSSRKVVEVIPFL